MEHIDFALSRSDVENLLSGFLIGSLNVNLKIRRMADICAATKLFARNF
jgi:hypothetical protein